MDTGLSNNRFNLDTSQFALWIAMGSITMMFAAFSSAYMVRQSAGNWLEFQLPSLFYISTAVIILSSITVHMSYWSFKKGKEYWYKGLLALTFILGVAFVGLQYEGWMQMFEMGIDMKRNPSGSFVYVISGAHAAHVLGGIATLIVALVHAFVLPYKPTDKRKNRFQLVVQYWHFVDILWVYLLLFFVFQR